MLARDGSLQKSPELGKEEAVDTGPAGPVGQALFVNGILLGLFALQHSIMAGQRGAPKAASLGSRLLRGNAPRRGR
jgi:hypothetical protein